MRFYWLILGILGVWQITDLLHARDGPWRILQRVRTLLTRLGLGNAVNCFYCLSMWVALPIAVWIGEAWPERALLWVALAGAAALAERTTNRDAPAPALYVEDAPDSAQQIAAHNLTEDRDNV